MSRPKDSHDCRCTYHPSLDEVADLIARAKAHPLHLEFLRYGALEAVAVTFGVHAFTVDAARRALDAAAQQED